MQSNPTIPRSQAKSPKFTVSAADLCKQLSLADVVQSHGVELRPAGRDRLRGLCPFHAEKNPSFYVFTSSNKFRFRCFACGEHGDAIDFLMKTTGCSFREALEQLTGKAPGHYRPDPKAIRKRRAVSRFRKWEALYSDFLCHWRGAATRLINRAGPEKLEENATLIRLLGVVDQQFEILASGDDRRKFMLYQAIKAGEGLDYVGC